MRCPKCGCIDDKVIDSRASREETVIRRRRGCLSCQHRFTTYEKIDSPTIMVIKRDGRREVFSREKMLSGLQKACQKRPVSQQAIEALVLKVEESLVNEYPDEIPGSVLGERVMESLRDIDPVAYVRYASVYRRFEEATDFVQAVKKLEAKSDTATNRLPGI